jgi:hypothetical protein
VNLQTLEGVICARATYGLVQQSSIHVDEHSVKEAGQSLLVLLGGRLHPEITEGFQEVASHRDRENKGGGPNRALLTLG